MKQSAVQWIVEQLIPIDQHEGIKDIIEEAMQIENNNKETETNFLVNSLELATELATQELENNWSDSIVIYNDEGVGFTDEAQDIFNDLYDKYLSLITNFKIN